MDDIKSKKLELERTVLSKHKKMFWGRVKEVSPLSLERRVFGKLSKITMVGLVVLVIVATVGTVGAMNGWFGGGGDIPLDTMTRGLVGYWSFDESSGNMAYDSSGNENHGILYNNPSWGGGKIGGAVDLDGVDDYVRASDSLSLTLGSAITVEAWVNLSSILDHASDQHRIAQKFIYPNNGWYLYYHETGRFSFTTYDGSAHNVSYYINPDLNVWYHIVGVSDGTNNTIYVNGVAGETSLSGTLTNSTDNFNIAGYGNSNYALNGKIDEVRIYDRALSAAEVRYHYNRGAPVAHWKFDEGSGTKAYDSAGNNDGTLTNGPLWVEGKYGPAIDFDGDNDYIYLGQPSDLNTNVEDVTISAWVKLDRALGMYSTNYEIFSNESYQNYGYLFRIEDSTNPSVAGKIHFRTNQVATATGITASSQSYPNDQAWHYLVVTKDGTVGKIYLDGLEVSSYSSYSSLSDPVDSSGGAYIGGPSQRFYGLIDDIKIYKYARSEEEIKLDYNAGFAVRFGPMSSCQRDPGSCMTKGLVGYWDFEEGSGVLTLDKSGRGNNGTLTNSPSWDTGIIPLSGGKTGGGAIKFDGINDYINLGSDSSLENFSSKSVFIWYKAGAYTGSSRVIYAGAYWNSTYGDYILLRYDGNNAQIGVRNTVGTAVTSDYIPHDIGEWIYLGYTWDGTTVKYYKNGIEYGSSDSLSGTVSCSAKNITLGADDTDSPTDFFDGISDEVKIYNRALSIEEIRYQYSQGEPVAHWKFDEGSGTTAYDSNGSNNGILTNDPTWTTGKYGSALGFDGNNDYVSIADSNSLDTENAITISAWIKTGDNYSGTQGYIARKGEEGAGNIDYGFSVQGSPGYLKFDFNNGGWQAGILDTSQSITDSTWHFVAVTYDRNYYIYYIDGVRGDSIVQTTAMAKTTKDLYIGNDLTAYYFNGLIDDVRIYNYARTEEQIKQDYNAGLVAYIGPQSSCDRDPGSCMSEGLVGYWDFEEGSGSLAEDKSGNENNGTLYNEPSWNTGIIPLSGGKTGGGSLSFDGVDEYVDSGNDVSLDITEAITLEVWYKIDTYEHLDSLVGKWNAAANKRAYWLSFYSGKVSFFISRDGVESPYVGYSNVTAGVWNHVIGTYDGTSMKIYFNGELKNTDTNYPGTLFSDPTQTLLIGSGVNTRYFDGQIDEVRIYNRALSAEEVRYHYNKGAPVAYWKFDEGSGLTAYDSANNSNNGVIVGANYVEGKYGSALNFDGTDDYIDCGNSNILKLSSSGGTVSLWFKTSTIPDNFDYLLSRDVNGYTIQMNTDGTLKVYWAAISGSALYLGSTPANLADGEWHHFSFTIPLNTSIANFYLDGALIGTDAFGTLGDNGTNLYIGGLSTVRNWQGYIDDVRIYNYVRTEEQIFQDYNAGLSAYFR